MKWLAVGLLACTLLAGELLACATFNAAFAEAAGAADAAAPAPMVVELPKGTQVPAASVLNARFDVDAATNAYLNLLSPEQRARSDAYFEGGYWLNLFSTLWLLAGCALTLSLGLSVRMRNWAESLTRRRILQLFFYGAGLVLLLSAFTLPMDFYTGYVREHAYGMSNQIVSEWAADWLVSLGLSMVALPPLIALVYLLLRRGNAYWWLSAGVCTLFIFMLLMVISPVLIAPLFNDYKPLPAGPVRDAVVALAQANGIAQDDLVYFDASKQTKRISANVSGLAGTTRISLNDNLLNNTSLPEIRAVMAHEMGHYVMNHGLRNAAVMSLLFTLLFGLMHWLWQGPLAALVQRLGFRDRSDMAGAPLGLAMFSLLALLASPIQNRIIYSAEAEADAFGLNAAHEPHGFATAAVRLGAYRKLQPTALEEWLFYDHPSGYTRIRGAMQWLKERPQLSARGSAWLPPATSSHSTD